MDNQIKEIHFSDIELENSPSFRGRITLGGKRYIVKKEWGLSEYFTSHLMGLMKIPVHDTSLAVLNKEAGFNNKELVVLCEDFTPKDTKFIPGFRLFEELFPDEDIQISYGPLHLKKVLEKYLGGRAKEALSLIAIKSIFDCIVKEEDFGSGNWGIFQGEESYLAPFYDNAMSMTQLMRAIDEQSFSLEKAINYALGEFWTPFVSFRNGQLVAREGFDDVFDEAVKQFKATYTIESFCSFVKDALVLLSSITIDTRIDKEAGMFIYTALALRYLHVIECLGKDELLEVVDSLF